MKKCETAICFNGTITVYGHESSSLNCNMKFSIFLPSISKIKNVPFLVYLSGLTCTYENFTTKANAFGWAEKEGIAIIIPDTSPRGKHVPDKSDEYDFGKGAGFYINATEDPWHKNYQMETYITKELHSLVINNFPLEMAGIFGHSMGGHGALSLYIKHPNLYKSVSAFAPIVAPSQVTWGQKVFEGYLGNNKSSWKINDSTALMMAENDRSSYPEILIDQGAADIFLGDQLKPELFEEACQKVNQKLKLRIHDGYDHSYYFIQSFIKDHIEYHAKILNA